MTRFVLSLACWARFLVRYPVSRPTIWKIWGDEPSPPGEDFSLDGPARDRYRFSTGTVSRQTEFLPTRFNTNAEGVR